MRNPLISAFDAVGQIYSTIRFANSSPHPPPTGHITGPLKLVALSNATPEAANFHPKRLRGAVVIVVVGGYRRLLTRVYGKPTPIPGQLTAVGIAFLAARIWGLR